MADPQPWRRDTSAAVAGGVIAGLATRLGMDVTMLRVAFVVVVIVTGGLALAAYAVAWLLMPADDRGSGPRTSPRLVRRRPRRGWRLGAGVGLLTLSALLVFRELGIWWSDALVWPLVLAVAGAALIWRQLTASRPDEPALGAAVLPGGHLR